MIKVSVIIPVYNAEKYLERCLDSVCNQTLKDIEIICVNDASIDNSIEILNDYSKRYSNLKVIDCAKNGGESKARNIGLDNATGEYVAFVDNDDTIDLDFYEKLYTLAKIKNLDIAKADCFEISIGGNKIKQDDNTQIKNNDKFAFVTHWWTAIYKRKIVENNKIRFREDIPLGGDIIFLNQMLVNSKTFDMIDDTFYYHYQQKNSGDSEFLSIRKIKSAVQSYSEIIKNLTENYPYKVSEIGYNYAVTYYLIAIYSRLNKNNSEDAIRIIVNGLFKLFRIIKNYSIIETEFLNNIPFVMYFYLQNKNAELVNFLLNSQITPVQIIAYKHKIKMLKGNI